MNVTTNARHESFGRLLGLDARVPRLGPLLALFVSNIAYVGVYRFVFPVLVFGGRFERDGKVFELTLYLSWIASLAIGYRLARKPTLSVLCALLADTILFVFLFMFVDRPRENRDPFDATALVLAFVPHVAGRASFLVSMELLLRYSPVLWVCLPAAFLIGDLSEVCAAFGFPILWFGAELPEGSMSLYLALWRAFAQTVTASLLASAIFGFGLWISRGRPHATSAPRSALT
jgi:hypothetical protein